MCSIRVRHIVFANDPAKRCAAHHGKRDGKHNPYRQEEFLAVLLLMSFCRIIRVPFSLTDNRLYM